MADPITRTYSIFSHGDRFDCALEVLPVHRKGRDGHDRLSLRVQSFAVTPPARDDHQLKELQAEAVRLMLIKGNYK